MVELYSCTVVHTDIWHGWGAYRVRVFIARRSAMPHPLLSGCTANMLGLPLIDMMTAHDEIPMLRYRLRLHAPIAIKTIILESNLSHAGHPKPLHVRNALSAEEIKRYKIELINVPFGYELERRMASCTNSSNVKCTWILEVAQRRFVMNMLQPTISRTLAEHGLDDAFVHMSDLDELLDVDAVRNLSLPGCVSPKLRNFVYGERCPATYPPWSRSVLFRARSGWLDKHMSPSLQLRKLAKGKECNPSAGWLGWHFGYFMPTEKILHKLSNFAHAHDPFIQRITKSAQPLADIERRVRNCLDVHGRRYGPAWAAYDGKLPEEPGWPRNPAAPAVLNVSYLLRERNLLQAEVSRMSRSVAGVGQGPVTPRPGLLAALGKLSSVQVAIHERGPQQPLLERSGGHSSVQHS